MTRFIGILLLSVLIGAAATSKPEGARYPSTSQSTTQTSATRFIYVDVYVDPKGEPLGAYQFEFTTETGHITIAGIEAGEHPAFSKQPPYYDLAAIQQNRVI